MLFKITCEEQKNSRVFYGLANFFAHHCARRLEELLPDDNFLQRLCSFRLKIVVLAGNVWNWIFLSRPPACALCAGKRGDMNFIFSP